MSEITIYDLMMAKHGSSAKAQEHHVLSRFEEIKRQLFADPTAYIEVRDMALALKCAEAGLYVAQFSEPTRVFDSRHHWSVSIP